MRLLIAEDERELANALAAILKHSHYSVDAVYDGEDALDYALTQNYDGIILDIMMPKRDGLSVLEELRRQEMDTPVLLLARIRAMTRRKSAFTPDVLSFGNIRLDRQNFELSGDTASLRLSNKEFQMMEMLMRSPGQVISAEQFMERIWGYDTEAEINVVWVYISYLRKKLAALAASVSIRATRGLGYSLEETHD